MDTNHYIKNYDDHDIIIVNGQCHRIYDVEYENFTRIITYDDPTGRLNKVEDIKLELEMEENITNKNPYEWINWRSVNEVRDATLNMNLSNGNYNGNQVENIITSACPNKIESNPVTFSNCENKSVVVNNVNRNIICDKVESSDSAGGRKD